MCVSTVELLLVDSPSDAARRLCVLYRSPASINGGPEHRRACDIRASRTRIGRRANGICTNARCVQMEAKAMCASECEPTEERHTKIAKNMSNKASEPSPERDVCR